MEENGRVIKIENKKALIRVSMGKDCGNCHMCKGITGNDDKIIEIDNDKNLKEGDNVKIIINSLNSIKTSFFVYILPLIFLVTGYFLGILIFGSGKTSKENIPAVLTSIFFVIIYFSSLFLVDKIFGKKIGCKIVVVRIN